MTYIKGDCEKISRSYREPIDEEFEPVARHYLPECEKEVIVVDSWKQKNKGVRASKSEQRKFKDV